jgi:2-polyprenyl-3-methyl-5-hydroxy-6-metoxy-1,4-benzoquinol methylase
MSAIEVPERIDALDFMDQKIPQRWKYHHIWRYNFAKKFVKNKVVVDVACGCGYGSYILSRPAKELIAIDKDPCFKEQYKKSNIMFVQADVACIPLESSSVDVVVSLETLEHLNSPQDFMLEVHRILCRRGLLIISTPNKNHSPQNAPYHITEFGKREFEETVSRAGFRIRKFLGQNLDCLPPFFCRIENKFPKLTLIRSYLGVLFPNHSTIFLIVAEKL